MPGRITVLFLIPACVSVMALDVADDDYTALMAIYDNCGGAAWSFSSPDAAWGTPRENAIVADWDGVSVANGRVNELDLRGLENIDDVSDRGTAVTVKVDHRRSSACAGGCLLGSRRR